MSSGEALSGLLAERFQQKTGEAGVHPVLHNLYGPTEAAVEVSYHACVAESAGIGVPIGAPIANLKLYVVDQWGKLAPMGAVGELCIGGVGVARGYWNQPALTAERFVPDGFSGGEGKRLYRTGDLARWTENGEIEYLGRLDHQVKIRGFRVELGEIECVLQQHPDVRQSAVVLRQHPPGTPRLVGMFPGWRVQRRHCAGFPTEWSSPITTPWKRNFSIGKFLIRSFTCRRECRSPTMLAWST